MRLRTIALIVIVAVPWQIARAAPFVESTESDDSSGVAQFGHERPQPAGFVYVATNDPTENRIIQFGRASDGSLSKLSEVPTGGKGGLGNGAGNLDPLGSQDSVVLSSDGAFLLAVNAGSNQLSSLRAGANGLEVLSKVQSGGSFPNSVALDGNLVYVLNAHGTPNVSGFTLSSTGRLQQLPDSIRNLPGGSAAKPHDVRFSPDGTRLLVTDEGTNQIDIFEVSNSGLLEDPVTAPSAGSAPFGFKFGRDDALLVTEANSASVSSYFLTTEDTLTVVSPAVPNGQAASCWISLTRDGKFGFVSNTASGTLSSYQVSGDGSLSLANPAAATADGGAPIDSALSSDSAFLYVVDSARGRILTFSVTGASLQLLARTPLPAITSQGIAVQ